MVKKSSKKAQHTVNTFLLNNSSKWASKVGDQIGEAATENNVDYVKKEMTPEKFYEHMNDKNKKKVLIKSLKKTDYFGSTGAKEIRKYDIEIQKFVNKYLNPKAVSLGICHGHQIGIEAEEGYVHRPKKGKMHHGERDSIVHKQYHDDPALEGVEINDKNKMRTFGYHQHYGPVDKIGPNLEVIAEGTSNTGEKFVEMYKHKNREDHYGIQFHDEKRGGKIIKNLFRHAYNKKYNIVDGAADDYAAPEARTGTYG